MHPCGGGVGRDTRSINDKVAHTAEKHIDRPPVEHVGVVRIPVNQAKPGKVGRGFEGRRSGSIAHELSKVGRHDGP
jgi:hypothetical protein